jgi:hypothetical protein
MARAYRQLTLPLPRPRTDPTLAVETLARAQGWEPGRAQRNGGNPWRLPGTEWRMGLHYHQVVLYRVRERMAVQMARYPIGDTVAIGVALDEIRLSTRGEHTRSLGRTP